MERRKESMKVGVKRDEKFKGENKAEDVTIDEKTKKEEKKLKFANRR